MATLNKRLYRPQRLMHGGYEECIRDNEQLLFYTDIVNHRNLEPLEFFDYVKGKYNFKSYSAIYERIERIGYILSLAKANTLKIIIDYKKAILNGDNNVVNELKSDFDKIRDIVLEENTYNVQGKKPAVFVKPRSKDKNLIANTLNSTIEDYLNGKEFTEAEYNRLKTNIRSHMSLVDKDMYTDLIIKKVDAKMINNKDLDDLIKVLEYFIFNLNNTLKEIKDYEDILDSEDVSNKIKNIFVGGEENLTDEENKSIKVLYNWKLNRLKKYIKVYNNVISYINAFKENIESDNKNLDDFKTLYYDLGDDFIKEILSDMSIFLKGYKQISKVMTSDEKKKNMKDRYIKKLYMN